MPQAPHPYQGDPDDKEFMSTLAKGLAVLGAFGRQRPTMTLSEAAQVADLSRATARRVLRTLTQLGYVEQDGRTFSLSPQILDLGFAYLSTQSWIDRALPLMRELSERLGEILLGRDPARQRHRLRRARAGPQNHVDDAVGRQPAACDAYGARPHPVRLPGRSRDLAAAEVASASRPTRRKPSPTFRRCSTASATTANRNSPSSTKNSSVACAHSPCRCSTAADKRRRHQPVDACNADDTKRDA